MGIEYGAWIEQYDTLHDGDRAAIRQQIAGIANPPVFSIVMPVYNPRPDLLQAAIESVRSQLYPHWELCIADDASTRPEIPDILSNAANSDFRITAVSRPVNGHITAATNTALALATGDFVAFLDHDDLLSERALYEFAMLVAGRPDTDIIYSDQDQIDDAGQRSNPFFKPDWDPDLILGQNFVNHLTAYRRGILDELGGLRPGFDGSQDYDLILRASRLSTPSRIRHVPSVLYHWRRGVPAAQSFSEAWLEQCIAAAHLAVSDHLTAIGTPAEVGPVPRAPIWNRVKFQIPDPAPPVSVIIPTRDRADLLETCVAGLLSRTSYKPAEIIIIDHDSVESQTHELFEQLTRAEPSVRILPYHGAYNYAAMNNAALAIATGEVIALLNNDIDVLDPEWLGEMVSHALRPGIGIVGAKLLYGDRRVQHAGILLGPGPSLVHVQRLAEQNNLGYFGQLMLLRNLSAVTGACLVARRQVLIEIGGLDEVNLPVAFNDVDLCLRAGDYGYRVVWTPFAELFHLEGASRGSDMEPEQQERFQRELKYLYRSWANVIENDPFHNKNVLFGWDETCIPAPPRLPRLWQNTAASAGPLLF